MDVKAENEDLKRRLAAAEEALRQYETIFKRSGSLPEARGSNRSAPDLQSGGELPHLLDFIDEGFCIIEVTGGDDGESIDYRFLQTNAPFEHQTGLVNAVGRRMRELEPKHEQHWFDRYYRIATTGVPERFEDRAEALGRWYDVYAFPLGDPAQRRVGILFRDVIQRKHAEEELARSHHLLQTTVDNSLQIIQLFKAVRDEQGEIVDFVWLLTNKQWNDRWGPRSGQSLLTENPAVVASGVWDLFLKVIETGNPITHEHYYNHEQFDGWFLQSIAKANDGIILSTLDITDRKRAEGAMRDSEERQKALVSELQHRTRNLIGIVLSLAERTVRASRDLAHFRQQFRDRIEALARVQGLLSHLDTHDRVAFDVLIRTEMDAMGAPAEKVSLTGPANIRLRSATVQTLAMALHELATNAVKYGALSQEEGRLAISWSLTAGDDGKPWLHVAWRESGVQMPPAGQKPQGSGQGRELIERALPYQLDAKTSYTLSPDGVHCDITLPLSKTMGDASHA